jgi:predicted adenylyl cyclase CyaB
MKEKQINPVGRENIRDHEVEIRSLLSLTQYEAIKDKFKKNGVEFLGEECIVDIYFCPKSTKSFHEIEMDDVGSYSLRLRSSTKDEKQIVELNTKTITKQGDHNAWEEHEISVSNLDEAQKILDIVGFKPFFKLSKHRLNYFVDNLNVTLEDIDGYGKVIEVEILTEKNNAENAKNTIKNFLTTNGIVEDQVVPKSVTNILMKKRSSF